MTCKSPCIIPEIMKMKTIRLLFFGVMYFLSNRLYAGDFVVLETEQGGKTAVVAGNVSNAGTKVSPCSTFKIIIAWAALEEGLVSPETRRLCADAYIPDTPRDLSLKEAMDYSSNDYFAWLAEKIGSTKLTAYLNQSGLLPEPAPDQWLSRGIQDAVHGGDLTVDAWQEHRFIQRVMEGKLASSSTIQQQVLECLKLPSGDSNIILYGKTGAKDGKVAWLTGFGCKNSKWKAVTVLVLDAGKDANKKRFQYFYERWGLVPPKN
jgi:beta-lactamase class D